MRSLLYALEEKTLSGVREDAVRRAKNFYAHGEKFLCARKFISVRTKKYFRAHRNFLASAGRFPCVSMRSRLRLGKALAEKPCVSLVAEGRGEYTGSCWDGWLEASETGVACGQMPVTIPTSPNRVAPWAICLGSCIFVYPYLLDDTLQIEHA